MPNQAREMPVTGGIVPGRNASGADILGQRILEVDPANAPDGVDIATAVTSNIKGVSMGVIVDGFTGDVQTDGLARVTSGAAVAVGDRVTSDAQGRAVTAAADNDVIAGVANTAASGAGIDIEVELVGGGIQRGL